MRATLWLLVSIAVVFMLQLGISGFTGAFVLDSSELASSPWTVITSMFLHGDYVHLFYNALALFMFGLVLENIIGTRKFALIYFIGGIIAGVAGAFLYPALLGASGAIFAVMGTLAVLRPRMTVYVGYFPMPMVIAVFVWIAIDLVGIIAPSGVANLSHIAGLIFGIATGLAMRKRFGQPFKRAAARVLSNKAVEKWEDRWIRSP